MSVDFDLNYLPLDSGQIKIVSSWEDLLSEEFNQSVNCILYPRRLSGDFTKLAQIGWDACEFYAESLIAKRDTSAFKKLTSKKLTSCVPMFAYLCRGYGPVEDGRWPDDVRKAFVHRGPESSKPGLASICHLKSSEPENWPPKP